MAEKGCTWNNLETQASLEIWSKEIQWELWGAVRNDSAYSRIVMKLPDTQEMQNRPLF